MSSKGTQTTPGMKGAARRGGWAIADSAPVDSAIRARLRAGQEPAAVAEVVGVALGYVLTFLEDQSAPSGVHRVQLPVIEEREAHSRVKCIVAGGQLSAAACVGRQAAEGCFCPKAVFALNATPAVTPREREDRLVLVARAGASLRGGPKYLGPAARVGEDAPLTAPGSAGLAAPGIDGACSCGARTIRGHGVALVVDKRTGRRHGRAACDSVSATPAADTTPMLVPSARGHNLNGAAAADSAQVVKSPEQQGRPPDPAGLGGPALSLASPIPVRDDRDPARGALASAESSSVAPAVPTTGRFPSAAPTPPPSPAPQEKKMPRLNPLAKLTDQQIRAARLKNGSTLATAKALGCGVATLTKREASMAPEESGARPGPEAKPPDPLPAVSDLEQLLATRLAEHEEAIKKLRVHEREAEKIRAALSAMKAA